MENKKYTVLEAAQVLDVVPSTVRRWIKLGQIDCQPIGKGYLIDESEVKRKVEEMHLECAQLL